MRGRIKKWLIGTVLIIGLVVLIFVWAGVSERPIIDYSLIYLPDRYDFSNGQNMLVRLGYDNRGEMDADLNLILTAINANVIVYNRTGVAYNGSRGVVHVSGTMAAGQSPFGEQGVPVHPYGNPSSFTIKCTIEDVYPIFSINGLISHIFLEQHGNVTMAVYDRVDASYYQLVK